MPLRHTRTRGSLFRIVSFVCLVATLWQADSSAQNKQGLGPGGSRLTRPDPPSSGTGFGPNTGFGPSTGSGSSGSSSSLPPGTRCVSIQCADGTTIPCNSSCPRPGANNPAPGTSSNVPGPGYSSPQPQFPQPAQGDPGRVDQARREADERQRREADERRREEFARSRDQALQLLRGVDSTELGLRGSGGLELRDAPAARAKPQAAGARSANSDPSVVDLSHLDPSKPAVVDPRAARGQKKFQVSEKTLTNDSYVKGFDAIRAANYDQAVLHFKKAKAELGNDLLVRNGLALAEDLVKMQKRKAQDTAAGREFHQGVMSAIHGNYDVGIEHIRKAIALDPGNPRYRDELTFVQGVKTGAAVAADKEQDLRRKAIAEKAFQVAEKSLAAMYRHDWTSAIAILEAALMINPDDRTIKDVLAIARNAERKEAAAQRNRVVAGKGQ